MEQRADVVPAVRTAVGADQGGGNGQARRVNGAGQMQDHFAGVQLVRQIHAHAAKGDVLAAALDRIFKLAFLADRHNLQRLRPEQAVVHALLGADQHMAAQAFEDGRAVLFEDLQGLGSVQVAC